MKSEFTGRLIGLIGISILQYLIVIFTLTLGTPWAICLKENWVVENTSLNGHQLAFDGTGWQLLGNIIKWILLSIVTLGIFLLWVPIKFKQWTTKHTHIVAHEYL